MVTTERNEVKTQHTPGPWTVEEVWSNPSKERGLVYAKIRSADGSVGFAGAYLSRNGKPDDECRANAHLIADAPRLKESNAELLEALENLRYHTDADWQDGRLRGEFSAAYINAEHAADAAIAKARGQP